MLQGLAVAALVAAVVVSAASAAHHAAPRIRLPIVPLPKSAFGPIGASLPVAYDSGTLSNADAAAIANGQLVTAKTLKNLGRVTGYTLDYGDPLNGGTGITQITTAVEEYKTAGDAKAGLMFWWIDDARIAKLSDSAGAPMGISLAVTNHEVKVPAIGSRHYAYLTTLQVVGENPYQFPTLSPIYSVDERLADGRFVLQVVVTAGTSSAAEGLAPVLATKLDKRLRQMVAGHLKAKPIQIPTPTAGPPAGGPDLSTLALTLSDIGNQGDKIDEAYVVAPPAVSSYAMSMTPADSYDTLIQEIDWYPSATEATYAAAVAEASFLATTQGTPIDVSTLGDYAVGATASGGGASVAEVVLDRGQAVDTVAIASSTYSLGEPDVASLAATVRNRLDPGVPG